MSSLFLENENEAEVARETGFKQCVHALRRTLLTTPVGWILVAWFCWDRVPRSQIWLWLFAFIVAWLLSLGFLQLVIREGLRTDRHAWRLLTAASLDGMGWGLTVWLLMGYDPILDPWLAAVLCGVAAVNAPVYITYIRAYYALIGTLWVVAMLALGLNAGHINVLNTGIGLTVFFVLLVYYMQAIGVRVLEGIRLQLSNASLADQLQAALQLMKFDAMTDALTGQPNRRALDEILKQQMAFAQKGGRPFAVLMLDIDLFKQINDTHGHSVGDDTLRAFTFRVREYLRQGDKCARFGGEEFVVVLPETSLETAIDVAERLRRGVAESNLLTVPPIAATVSIGAAAYTDGQTIEGLLKRADAAVYAAKRGGRNQVRTSAD